MNRTLVFCIMFIILLSSIGSIVSSLPIESVLMRKKDALTIPQITIWIHGTLFLFKHIIPKFLHIEQGLTRLSDTYPNHYYRSIIRNLEQKNPKRFSFENFYLFGWSGKLSSEDRLQGAKKLNDQLYNLIIEFKKKYKKKPFIRIITHSHGGNVALNLANIQSCNIEIDELILLACPVQKKTESLIHNQCFKNIISLFSKIDLIQILDPQGFYDNDLINLFYKNSPKGPFFSQRTFQPHEKVVQAKIKINGNSLLHIDFMLEKFLMHLSEILDRVENHKQIFPTTCFEKPFKIDLP